MDARLQRRIQRYGWDLAASDYEPLWQKQLAVAQDEMLACAAPQPGERVLDVACGTGLVTLRAAQDVGPQGEVIGTDISAGMIDIAWTRATTQRIGNVRFQRMGAESLDFPDKRFDVVLCGLGLMYVTHPEQALHEMRRVLRPGGRMAIAVWGERGHCGWSPVFPIVDAEVSSDVCPLFFGLGQSDTLARLCADAEFRIREHYRVDTVLHYADGEAACDAAFVGGPVALAWSRFDAPTRQRVRSKYLEAIQPWRDGEAYRIPGEFVIVSAEAAIR
ncbi:class I SAM-dependent methyltransferase [Arenimonas sp.]|uniref:class I SAM-dependent methyltransferase n=1 Tax=Arenimonas sp. TaxID=1872635 RepID=UPI0039E2E5CC